jgi:hypothetical protein
MLEALLKDNFVWAAHEAGARVALDSLDSLTVGRGEREPDKKGKIFAGRQTSF